MADICYQRSHLLQQWASLSTTSIDTLEAFAAPQRPLITLKSGQNGHRHFPDDNLKRIFLNENICISIKISLKFVPKGPINNIPALVQIMAWHRPGDKPLSEPIMFSLLTHICVTRPQWVFMASHNLSYPRRSVHTCSFLSEVYWLAAAKPRPQPNLGGLDNFNARFCGYLSYDEGYWKGFLKHFCCHVSPSHFNRVFS